MDEFCDVDSLDTIRFPRYLLLHEESVPQNLPPKSNRLMDVEEIEMEEAEADYSGLA